MWIFQHKVVATLMMVTLEGKCSRIHQVDERLIKRLSVLLFALNSNHYINPAKYNQYAEDTALHHVELYPWFLMPISVHKMLMHGAAVIDALIIPIGQASEEGIEARHKEIRNARMHHTCKISRTRVNKDLMQWFLASSDPLVASNCKPKYMKKDISLPPEVESLLQDLLVEVGCTELFFQFVLTTTFFDAFNDIGNSKKRIIKKI